MKLPVQRIKTALVFAAVLLPLLLINSWTHLALWIIVLILSLVEYARLLNESSKSLRIYIYGVLPFVLAAAHFLYLQTWLQKNYVLTFAVISCFIVLILFWACFVDKLQHVYKLPSLISMFFIGNAIALMVTIEATNKEGAWLVLYLILLIWASDIGAFFAGKNLGKHKLVPKVSPNKTWEGLIGGITLAMILGIVMSQLTALGNIQHWLILGFLAGTTGLFGDLIESKIKRIANVKDSGQLLPGHGGILDRFDGLYGFAPFAFIYLYLVGVINI